MADPILPLPGVPRLSDYMTAAGGDASFAHALMDRDAQIKASAPSPGGDYAPRGDGNWLTAGLGAGWHGGLSQLGSAAEAATRFAGWQGGADAASRFAEGERQSAAGYERPDLEQAPWYDPRKIGYEAAKAIPAGAATIGAGLVGAATAPEWVPTAVAGGLAGALASYPFSVGSNVQAAEGYTHAPLTPGQAGGSLALGVPEAALFALPAGKIANTVGLGIPGAIKNRVIKGAAEQAAFMAPVSAAQDALTQLMGDPNRTMADRAHEIVSSALSGGITGGIFGAAAGAFSPAKPTAEIAKVDPNAVSTPQIKDIVDRQLGLPQSETAAPPPNPDEPLNAAWAEQARQQGAFDQGNGLERIAPGNEADRLAGAWENAANAPPPPEPEPAARPFAGLDDNALLAQASALQTNGRDPARLAGLMGEMRVREAANRPAAPDDVSSAKVDQTSPNVANPAEPAPVPTAAQEAAVAPAPAPAPQSADNEAPFAYSPRSPEAIATRVEDYKAPWEFAKEKEIPKAQTLRAFLRSKGGIRDDGGELKALFDGGHQIGLISKKGMPLDRAREAAAELGYLGADRSAAVSGTTISDLLDALRGEKVYSPLDADEVDRAQSAAKNNAYAQSLKEISGDISKYWKATGGPPLDKKLLVMAADLLHSGDVPSSEHEGRMFENAVEHAARLLVEEEAPDGNRGGNPVPAANGTQVGQDAGAQAPPTGTLDAVRDVGPATQTPGTEPGPEGSRQTLIPGVEPVTDRQRAQVIAGKPLKGGNAPMDRGLFAGPLEPELLAKADANAPRTPLDQEIAAKVSAGASAQDIFSHIAQNHPDADMRAVADALRKSGVNPTVKWLDKATDADLASKIKPEDVTGLYSKTQNRIGLLTGDDATRTMLHEGVHAATANAIDGNTTAAVAIKKIYATLKARSPNDDAYGLTNTHEFVAEAMTNPQFRDFLKGETAASGSAAKDMWQTFKNVVFKALRMPERARNAFDQVMEQMPGLMGENATADRPPVAPGDELPAMAQKHDDAVREGVNFAQGALDRFAERGGVSGVASRAKMAFQGTLNQALHNASLIHNAPEMPTVKGYFDTVMKGTNYQHVQDKVRAKLDQAHDFFRGDKTLKRSIDNFALGTNRGINGMEPIDQLAHLAPDDVADKAGWIRSSKDPKAVAWRQAHDDAQKAFNEINKTPEGRDALAKMIAGTRFGPRAAHIAAMDNAVRMNPLLKTLLEDNPAFKGDFFGDFQNRTDAHDNTVLANDLAGQTLRAKTTALSGVLDQLKDWKQFLKPKGEAFKKQWEAYGDAKDDFDRLRKIVDGITGSEAAQDKVPNFAVGRQGDWAVAGRIAGQDGKLSEANFDKLRDRLSAEGFDNAVIDYMTGNPDVYIRTETKEQAARLGNLFRQAAKDGVLNADKASGGKPIFEGPRKSGMDWQGIPLSELHKFGQLMAGAMPERPTGMSDEEWRPLANAHEQAQADFARQYLDMLPDTSLTKIFVKRKMVQGYAPDVLTANSQRASNMARGVANLAIAPERATALSAINKQLNGIMHSDLPVERKEALNQIVQELAAREKARQSNTANTAIDAIRSVTHVAGIGLSVPYFLLLQSQLLTLVHPELGKIFGHVDAAKAMMSATPKALEIIKQVLSDPNARRTMQLRAETLKPNGRLSQADIDNILREDNRGGFNNSGFTSTDTGGNFSHGFKHAIELGSMMSMYSEQLPKLITFLAGHDLATKSPGKVPKNLSAEEYAHYANDQANMAFGAGTTPRLFSAAGPAGQVGKLMAQFMSFSSQLGQKIYREVDDSFGKARPGETEAQAQLRRSQGRQWLGSHAAATAVLAGSLGLPGPSFAMGVFDKLADWATGEDSWDVQTQYRNWLSNTFGQKAGEIIARGAPRALGFDMSKSGEGELPDRLMPFMQLLTEKRKFEDAWPDFLKHMAGPATGLGVRTVLGARDMLNGDFLKGAIRVLPELFKAPLEAAQIAQLGGYPNNKGVVDARLHPGPLEIGEAALGVDTAGQAEARETDKVKAGLDAMRLYHNQNILHHLALAKMRNDPESEQQWMTANQDYKQEHPGMRPPVAGLQTYLQEHMRNEALSRQTGLPAGVHPRDLATRQALSFGNFVGR